MPTSILGITELTGTQANKYATWNAALRAIENSISEVGDTVDLSGANYTILPSDFTSNCYWTAINNSVTRTITVPATKRVFSIRNGGSADLNVTVSGGATTSVTVGSTAYIFSDGTTPVALASQEGATYSFTSLGMTPDSYTGLNQTRLRVNAAATGLELVNDPDITANDYDLTTEYSTTSPSAPGLGDGMDIFCRELPTQRLASTTYSRGPEIFEPLIATEGFGMLWPFLDGTSELTGIGLAFTQSGQTNAVTAPTTGSALLEIPRASIWTATTVGSGAYVLGSAAFARGATLSVGGFDVVLRFGIETFVASSRSFVGLHTSTAYVAGDANLETATGAGIGIYRAASGSNWQLFQKATGSSAVLTDLGGNFPANTTNTDAFELRLHCAPGGVPEYTLRRLGTAHVVDGVFSGSNLPTTSETLQPEFWLSNGTTSTQCKIAVIGLYASKADAPSTELEISATGTADADAFGSPTMSVEGQGVAATSATTVNAFGSPLVADAAAATSILPVAISDADAFGTPQLDLDILPTGAASAEAFGEPLLSVGENVVMDGFAETSLFGTPVAELSIAPTAISDADGFGVPVLSQPVQTVTPTSTGGSSSRKLGYVDSFETSEAWVAGAANRKLVTHVRTYSDAGKIADVKVIFHAITTGNKVKAVLYNSNGDVGSTSSWRPTTLIATGTEVTLDSSDVGKIVTLPFSVPVALAANGSYCIGLHIESSGTSVKSAVGASRLGGYIDEYSYSGRNTCYNTDTYSDGAAASFGTLTQDGTAIAIWTDYYDDEAFGYPVTTYSGDVGQRLEPASVNNRPAASTGDLGLTTAAAGNSVSDNKKIAQAITTGTVPVRISAITGNFTSIGAGAAMRPFVYKADGANVVKYAGFNGDTYVDHQTSGPHTLLAVGPTQTYVSSTSGIKTLPLYNTLILEPNTVYWIGFHRNTTGTIQYRYSNGGAPVGSPLVESVALFNAYASGSSLTWGSSFDVLGLGAGNRAAFYVSYEVEGDNVGAVAMALDQEIAPSGIASVNAFTAPIYNQDANTLYITAHVNEEAFGTPDARHDIGATSATTTNAFGTFTYVLDPRIDATGIPAANAFGAVLIGEPGEDQDIEPTAMAPSLAFGSFTLEQAPTPVVETFDYTGASDTYTIPSGYDTLTLNLWGGAGGGGIYDEGAYSGAGGYVEATFDVDVGDVIKVEVGQGGGGGSTIADSGGDGGWPDGGPGALGDVWAGGGGGSTRVYINNVLMAVAGGGGGSGGYSGAGNAGAGGGLLGQNADTGGGTGGTQSAGGVDSSDTGDANKTGRSIVAYPGVQRTGGWGASDASQIISTSDDGGGGGGGYWGGGGGGGDAESGGGGSSWTHASAQNVVNEAGEYDLPFTTTNAAPGTATGVNSTDGSVADSGGDGYARLVLDGPYTLPPLFINPNGIASTSGLGTVTTELRVIINAVNDTVDAFGSVSIVAGTVGADGFAETTSYGAPSIEYVVHPASLDDSADAFGTYAMVDGSQSVAMDGFSDADAFGDVATEYVVAPSGVDDSVDVFGTMLIGGDGQSIEPTSVENTTAFGAPELALGYVLQNALLYRSTAGTASPIPLDTTTVDHGRWRDSVTQTQMRTPEGSTLVRVVSNVVDNNGSSHAILLNGGVYRGMARGGTATGGADVSGALSAIVEVPQGDAFTLTSAGGSYDALSRTWLGGETIDPALKRCLIYPTSGTTIAATTNVTIPMTGVTYDVGGWHATDKIVVPSGVTLMRISAGLSVPTGATSFQLSILKNGANFTGMPQRDLQLGTDIYNNLISSIVVVTPGDEFTVVARCDNATTSHFAEHCWLCAEEVSTAAGGYVMVTKSVDQTANASVATIITFPTETTDALGLHDPVTNNERFTIPVGSGITKARFSFGIGATDSDTGQVYAGVYKNDAIEIGLPQYENDTSGGEFLNAIGAWVDVAEGDYFDVRITPGATRTIAAAEYTWFCIEYVTTGDPTPAVTSSPSYWLRGQEINEFGTGGMDHWLEGKPVGTI